MSDNLLIKLHTSPKTVLTTRDIALLWRENNPDNLKAKISYYIKRGELVRLRRGVFAKSDNYDPKELSTSLYAPSYISFETALLEAGIIFQYYETIFAASRVSKTISIGGRNFTYRKIKDLVLLNSRGIIARDGYFLAGPERAFLDMIYLFPDYYFDNLRSLDWEVCTDIVSIYKNKKLERRLLEYKKSYADQ